jgi:hypothetical protein
VTALDSRFQCTRSQHLLSDGCTPHCAATLHGIPSPRKPQPTWFAAPYPLPLLQPPSSALRSPAQSAPKTTNARLIRPVARVRNPLLNIACAADDDVVYGDCGVGAFCLGGCDPLMSHSFDSCVPGPTCKSATYSLDSLDDVQTIDKYLGDASKINWQSQGMPAIYTDPANGQKSTLLTMAKGTVGTLLASTHYVWYGKICSKLSTAQGKGVVTAFILMSDVKDEIDFEWIGVDTGHVQSNFYSQGVTNCT